MAGLLHPPADRDRPLLAGQRHADGRYIPAYRGIPWCSKTRENSKPFDFGNRRVIPPYFVAKIMNIPRDATRPASPLVAGQVSCLRPHFMKIRFGAA
jgi:hypothetical protein